MTGDGDNFRIVTGPDAAASLAAHFAQVALDERRFRTALASPSFVEGPITDDEKVVIRRLWPRLSANQIARILHRPSETIDSQRQRMGLTRADKT